MKIPFRLLAVLAVLSLATLACSLTDLTPFGSSQPTQATSVPTVLFEDDFSRTSSGWDRYSDDETSTDYFEDTYQIKVDKPNWYTWANPGKTFEDVRVEVDAWQADGHYADAAILCRYKDEENFYMIGITTDGYYAITKIIAGEDTLLGSDLLEFSSVIKTGAGETNHLRADCVGDRLSLYVNGEIVAEVTDGDLTSGDIGLASGTYDDPGTDVRFDNFVVYRP